MIEYRVVCSDGEEVPQSRSGSRRLAETFREKADIDHDEARCGPGSHRVQVAEWVDTA